MAISMGSEGGDEAPMSDINTTPLVDVMLVLLIIFLITVPVVLETVDLKLPDVVFEPTTSKAENVLLSVRGAPDGSGKCEVYWGTAPITNAELRARGKEELDKLIEKVGGIGNVNEENMPEVHIRGDINTPYRCIGGVIYNMQFTGFQKIGFISEPPAGAIKVKR